MWAMNDQAWPWGKRIVFMLNSAEHEICLTSKSQIIDSCKLNKAEHEIFSVNKYENANYSYLSAGKISCSAKLGTKKVL